MDANSPIMWPVFGLLIALAARITLAADTTVISMVVPAEGNVAMIQKASIRHTVRLVGEPQKVAEQPRRTLQEMTSHDFKQLIDKTSKVEVQLSETDSEAPSPSASIIDTEELLEPDDLSRQLSRMQSNAFEDAKQNGTMEQMPNVINDAKEHSDVHAEKNLTEKDQPSQTDNASELSKIENAAEEEDTADADTEKTNSRNEETDNAKTEGAGVEAREDAEIAVAKGQEIESKGAKEAPEMNEEDKEENNNTLASEDSESEKFDDKTTDDAVEEGEETDNDGDTIDATTYGKNSEVQAGEQSTENTILTSKDTPTSGEGDYHWKKVRGPGDTLSLDNDGFEAVVKLKDTEQASVYIRRILHKQGFLVSNKTGLLKYAGVCSKGHGPQSFELLSKQILKAVTEPDGWAGIVRKDSPEAINPAFKAFLNPSTGVGLTSSLNQVGYLAVANLTSASEMSVYIHRIINHLSLIVVSTWGLMGIIPYYDGEDMVQSFAALVTELLGTAVQPGKWISVDPERP